MPSDVQMIEGEVGSQIERIVIVGGRPYQINLGQYQRKILTQANAVPDQDSVLVVKHRAVSGEIPLRIHFTDEYDQIQVRGCKV